MKKKYYSFLILVCALFLMLQITLLANDVLLPKQNVATTTTNVSIFESGRAIINIRYTGYPEITRGAGITMKIERKVSALIWENIVSQEYHTDDVYHVNKFEYPLTEMGTYRFTVTYVIEGNAGKDDVIKVCEEKIYDESCPAIPPLRSSEDFNHDCTSKDCCEYCYKLLGAIPSSSHKSSGNWSVYNDEYHYSNCANDTVSSVKCLQIMKEKHQFDDNLVCEVCGYKKLTFTEVWDEENNRVTITLSADDQIWSRVNVDWLDTDAYEIVNYEYYGTDCVRIEGGGYQIVERKYTDFYVSYRAFKEGYTIHVPIQNYAACKQKGIEIYLCSEGRRFTAVIYPKLVLD